MCLKWCDFLGIQRVPCCLQPAWEKKWQRRRSIIKSGPFTKWKFLPFHRGFPGAIAGNLYWNAGLGVFHYGADEVNIEFWTVTKTKTKTPHYFRTAHPLQLLQRLGPDQDNELHGEPPVRAVFLLLTHEIAPTNPNRGIWADAFNLLRTFGDQKRIQPPYLECPFRHYVPVWGNKIIFAYRLGYQGSLWGNTPVLFEELYGYIIAKRANYECSAANSVV